MFGKLVGKFVPVPFGAYEHGLGWVGFQGWSCMQPLGIGNIFRSHPWSSWYTWWCDGVLPTESTFFLWNLHFFCWSYFEKLQAPSWNSTLCEKWRSWKNALRTWLEWQEYHDQGGPGVHPWRSWILCDTEGLSKFGGVEMVPPVVLHCFTMCCFTLLALSWWLLLPWRQVIEILVVC